MRTCARWWSLALAALCMSATSTPWRCAAAETPGAAARKPEVVRAAVRTDSAAPGYEGFRALDGNPETMWHTPWGADERAHPHQILLDLKRPRTIQAFVYLARRGAGNGTIARWECYVGDDARNLGAPVASGTFERTDAPQSVALPPGTTGRYFCLKALSEINGTNWTSIAELELRIDGVKVVADSSAVALPLGVELPGEVVEATGPATQDHLETEWARQHLALWGDLGARSHFARVAPETYRPEALILPEDRDPLDVALRRAEALVERIAAMPGAPDLSAQRRELAAVRAAASGVPVEDSDGRYALYRRVCAARRAVALANPLLDFDSILFVKRHRSTFNHMCDQYYGINALPGGGLYILSGAFSGAPVVRDVLAGAVVQSGRLAGRTLAGGSFLSPDLSFDARRIAFAYVECQGDTDHRFHTDPARGHWHEGRCYHIFTVGVDGTDLRQLTDGTWNDFDPCWLPNGRIAFITERRGGYLRCGRVCPTYTLYDMAPDGGDIRPLSVHETNEWHPSVAHDGRIVYTRWDYVDRHGCTAHMPWLTTLDGRDSRALHGNFALRRLRPDMELDCRAIPGSPKFVATAAPHHGQAFGSLVLIDPRVEDDDAMAPVRRLTPEVGFPESQGGAQVYGTAWPLSEDFHLCVYDVSVQPGAGRQGGGYLRGDYGIYLIDSLGNKELIYRDPEIACLSPIPLRARPMPAAAPPMVVAEPAPLKRLEGTRQVVEVDGKPAEGTLALVNVYDSLMPWPKGTHITALRVLQVLPMTVPSGSPPHEVGYRVATAGDSVVPVRYVLGTVPVEADGSAHFVVPAHKELFFQALDERGLAVQSMRSATYLQPGERLVCQGCHEPKHRVPASPSPVPLALRKPPVRPAPDVDGSNPFSYPRLVQPVLERHCVECHAKDPDKAPNLAREPITRGWYASYHSLVPKFAFVDYGSPVRTTPGKFGARASRLHEMLEKGHHDVRLSDEEMHRIDLWLDCVSVFYGVYEREGGEAQLRGEIARPTLE